MKNVLLLGGTTEARQIAEALAVPGVLAETSRATVSFAGRTALPPEQPLPFRVGGFGGVAGLVGYLREAGISHVIDATHPFAAAMSRNAVAACAATATPLIAVERAPWQPGPDDDWLNVDDVAGAVAALPTAPARVFLAIGRQLLTAFAVAPQHRYLLRLVDPPEQPLPLPNAECVVGRGPFTLAGDLELMRTRGIAHVVAKNAGGQAARAKLDAARHLRVPVIMIARPAMPARRQAHSVAEVLAWLEAGDHGALNDGRASARRGV